MNCLEIIATILAIFFSIVDFSREYLKNVPIIKYIYPENWYKYIKVYIFTNIDVASSDLDCKDVSIRAEKIDPESEITNQIPFKLCILRSDEKTEKIETMAITFEVGQGTDLHIIECKNKDLGRTIELDQKSLHSGFQGRYFIKISRAYGGVAITININAQIYKKNKKRPRLMKTNLIINALETKSITLRA